MGGIKPIEPDLSCLVGADYFDTFQFKTGPPTPAAYDFSANGGWSNFRFEIGDIALIETAGLDVDYVNGRISPSVSETVTSGIKPGTVTYSLTALDPNGKKEFLMLGVFEWLRST